MFTFALAARGDHAEIAGIDLAEPYVDYARQHNTDPRLSFGIADAASLPFSAASFDRAYSQLVIQFLTDPFPAMAEMHRVVRPGGMVAATLWDGYGGQPHLRMLWDTPSALGFDPSRTLFRPLDGEGEMAPMWRRAGLIEVKHDMITIRIGFDTFDDYWSPFLSGDAPAGELVTSLTPGQRAVPRKAGPSHVPQWLRRRSSLLRHLGMDLQRHRSVLARSGFGRRRSNHDPSVRCAETSPRLSVGRETCPR